MKSITNKMDKMEYKTNRQKSGHLDIILGSMCSGKTKELLRRVSTLTNIDIKVLYINSSLDTRKGAEYGFSTHDVKELTFTESALAGDQLHNMTIIEERLKKSNLVFAKVDSLEEIDINLLSLAGFSVIAIDEGQFFTDLYDFCQGVVESYGLNMIVAGLDGDRFRNKFGQILDLIPICDTVVKLQSYCKFCGSKCRPGIFTCYTGGSTVGKLSYNQNLVGGKEMFAPACRSCYLTQNF